MERNVTGRAEPVAATTSLMALCRVVLPDADPLDKVTIIPRGHALGATEQIPQEERHNLHERYVRLCSPCSGTPPC